MPTAAFCSTCNVDEKCWAPTPLGMAHMLRGFAKRSSGAERCLCREHLMASFPLPIKKVDITPPRDSADCGECTACCDVQGVVEVGKPAYARCVHPSHHCEIYESRPATCRGYRCNWHMGF